MKLCPLNHCINVNDLLINIDLKKLKFKNIEYRKINNGHGKREFCKKLFIYHFDLVMKSIIKNNSSFHLPINNDSPRIELKRISNEEFSKYRKKGYFLDVDFLKSFFSGYVLTYFSGKTFNRKEILTNNEIRGLITELTNENKIPSSNDTYLSDYLELTYLLFPEVPHHDIKYILTYCWRMYYLSLKLRCDVVIVSSTKNIFYYCGKYMKDPVKFYHYFLLKKFRKSKIMYNRKYRSEVNDEYAYFTTMKKEHDLEFIMNGYKKTYPTPEIAMMCNYKARYLYRIKNNGMKFFRIYDIKGAEFVKEFELSLKTVMKL